MHPCQCACWLATVSVGNALAKRLARTLTRRQEVWHAAQPPAGVGSTHAPTLAAGHAEWRCRAHRLAGLPHLRMAMAQKTAASGQMTWAIHVTIAPTWFDPAETPGVITPYM